MTTLLSTSADQRFVLRDADWSTYQGFLQALGDRPIRVTYDRGRLELMTLSLGHERFSHLLCRFVETLTEELHMAVQNAGSTTFNREDLDRGIESDHCFYIEHEPLVREKDEIDLTIDPPPDLALEIDISRSSLNRMGIYAAIKVPEVWRFDGTSLTVYLLQESGSYKTSATSGVFPFLPMQELVRFLKMRTEMDDNSVVRAFRAWVRERIAAEWK